jgi:hypothetical protein
MSELKKPPNLTPLEEWARQHGSDRQRRRIAWAAEKIQQKKQREAQQRKEDAKRWAGEVKRVVYRTTVPHRDGLF